ncbi:MAG: hypothetical protein U1E62_07010 [Alsobacter sp.]
MHEHDLENERLRFPSLWTVAVGAGLVGLGLACFWRLLAGSGDNHILTGVLLIVAGLAEGLHAIFRRSMAGIAAELGPSMLFLLGGIVIVADPLAGSFGLSVALVLLVACGAAMRFLAGANLRQLSARRVLIATAIVAAFVVLVMVLTWPKSGVVVLDSVAAAGLILAGVSWIVTAFARVSRRPEAQEL